MNKDNVISGILYSIVFLALLVCMWAWWLVGYTSGYCESTCKSNELIYVQNAGDFCWCANENDTVRTKIAK